MSTLTQAPTGNAIAQQAKALKGSTKAPAAAPVSDWAGPWVHDGWQVEASGPRPTREMITLAAALVHAMGGRTGNETMHIAMCFRPGGCTVKQFTNIQNWAQPVTEGPVGPANNKRNKLSARATGGTVGLGWVNVTELRGTSDLRGVAFHLHVTPKGAAVLKGRGISADLIAKFSKAPDVKVPKATKVDKGDKAQPKAAKPRNGAGKAAGKGDKVVATTPPATPPKPASEPAKPVAVPTVSQGTPQVAPLAGMTPLGIKPQS